MKIPRKGPVAEAARAVRDPGSVRARVVHRDRELIRERLWVEYDKPGKLSFGPLWLYLWDDKGNWPGDIDPYTWPERREIACASAITRLGWSLETQTEDYVSGTLEALVDPYQPLAPTTLRFILLSLCSGAEREHLVATDLLIAAIEDGRVDAPALIPHLRTDLELVMTSRLGPRLATIAQAGPLHRAIVRDLLDAVSDRLEPLPTRAYAPLLTVLDELCAQTGTRVGNRAFLETLSGSSKAAKAANSLLARDGEPPPSERELLLAARVRRAERWLTR